MVIACTAISGWAQKPVQYFWDARALVRSTTSNTVELVDTSSSAETKVITKIPREVAVRLVDLVDREGRTMQVPPPQVVISFERGETPNAFATVTSQGPLLAVNYSMLRLTSANEAMLAAVVGHELGHLKANHPTRTADRSALVDMIGVALGTALDVSQAKKGRDTRGAGMALGTAGAALVNAKFTRDQEREADELGIQAMAAAGYNPAGAAVLWRTMSAKFPSGQGLWLDTHPSHPEREQALAARATELREIWVAAGVERGDPRAQAALAFDLATGTRGARDLERARALAQQSAAGGDPAGKSLLSRIDAAMAKDAAARPQEVAPPPPSVTSGPGFHRASSRRPGETCNSNSDCAGSSRCEAGLCTSE